MIKFENIQVVGWEPAIRGMRNPMNSWEKSDSGYTDISYSDYVIGPADYDLMMKLASNGPVHAKYRRMIVVYVDVTAPLYWWKEFDTYKVGTVANSCSTMHKIHAKEFTLEDFSIDHIDDDTKWVFERILERLNICREAFNNSNDKDAWWQMIQLLPSSYNQKRTVMLNYEVLAHIYPDRKNHKLDEWCNFCHWIGTLPYSELITGIKQEDLNYASRDI